MNTGPHRGSHRETIPLTIRLPRRLYDWLKADAQRLRRSISGQAVYLLERESLDPKESDGQERDTTAG